MFSKTLFYYQTKFHLPIFFINRKAIISLLDRSISEFAESEPQASYSDYIETFGTPKDYATSLLEELPATDIKKNLNFNTYSVIIICVLILLLIIAIIFCIYMHEYSSLTIVVEDTIGQETIYSK